MMCCFSMFQTKMSWHYIWRSILISKFDTILNANLFGEWQLSIADNSHGRMFVQKLLTLAPSLRGAIKNFWTTLAIGRGQGLTLGQNWQRTVVKNCGYGQGGVKNPEKLPMLFMDGPIPLLQHFFPICQIHKERILLQE